MTIVRSSLPEFHDYRDTGCEVAPRCLECPLPRCKYDGPYAAPSLKPARDSEVVQLYADGRAVGDIVNTVGISRRTVYRILEQERKAA